MADGTAPHGSHFVPDATNARAFRDALGSFATGVTLVTISTDDGPQGFVANSFSSLSIEPPLVLWSPSRSSSRFAAFAAATYFAIHVLAEHQRPLIDRFMKQGAGFDGLAHDLNHDGAPILPMAAARFDCRQFATHDGGDHLIIVGEVLRVVQSDLPGLVFKRGQFGGFSIRA